MASDHHKTLSVELACREFTALHEIVCQNWGRVEIVNDGDEEGCVLISKAELSHIERALEILCELPGGKAVCEHLTQLAKQTTARSNLSGLIDPEAGGMSAGNSASA